jgi:ribosome-binding protein aMBF1 (putative translation factor)
LSTYKTYSKIPVKIQKNEVLVCGNCRHFKREPDDFVPERDFQQRQEFLDPLEEQGG